MNTYLLLLVSISVLISLIGLLELKTKNNYYFASLLFIVSLFLVLALRPIDYFADTHSYVSFYLSLPKHLDFSFTYGSFQQGFVSFSQIIKVLSGKYYYLYFLAIIILNFSIIYYCLNEILKLNIVNDTNVKMALLAALYFSYIGFMYNAIVLRGGIGISFILLSIVFFLKRKYIISIIALLIAISFHSSMFFGLFYIPILLLNRRINSNIYYIVLTTLYIFSLIGISKFVVPNLNFIDAFFQDNIAKKDFNTYLIQENVNIKFSFSSLYLLLTSFVFVKYRINNYQYDKLLNIYIFGVVMHFLLYGSFSALSRFTEIFTVVGFILVYIILVKNKYKDKILIYAVIYIIANFLLFYRLGARV